MKLTSLAIVSHAHFLWGVTFINIKFAPPTKYYPIIKHRMKTTDHIKPNHSLAVQSFQSSPTESHFNPEEHILAIQLPEMKPGPRKTKSKRIKDLGNGSARKSMPLIQIESSQVQFSLHAPTAQSVQLAGDFSDWDRFSVKMIKGANGIWKASVTLPPGRHSYRFLVDGEWCDDPNCTQFEPNPFGSMNAVIEVF